MRGGEERGAVVLDQRLLVGVLGDPEDDDVVVPLAGLGVVRVGPRVAEEDEALAADLVHRVLAGRSTVTPGIDSARSWICCTVARFGRAMDPTVLRGVLVQALLALVGQNLPWKRSTRISGSLIPRLPSTSMGALAGLVEKGLVAPDWATALGPVDERIAAMGQFLRAEIAAGRAYLPAGDHIFRAFQRPLKDVRVLIVGQDPYPPGHPIGLSFAVDAHVRPLPPSLRNIYQELGTDLGAHDARAR